MPLYFILSGIFFKDYGGYIQTIIKKVNKLIIPCLFFYLIGYVVFVIVRKLTGGEIDLKITAIFTSTEFVNSPLWFLFALFWTNILFLAISKTFNNQIHLFFATAAIATIGLLMSNSDIRLPLFIGASFLALPFFFLGYSLRKTLLLYPNKYDKYTPFLIIILLSAAIPVSFSFGELGMGMGSMTITGNLLLNYLASSLLVCAFLLVSKMAKHIPIISYAGRYSIIILGIHGTLQQLVSLAFMYFGYELSDWLCFLLTTAISILTIPVFVKYFPYFTAQKDLIALKKRGRTADI